MRSSCTLKVCFLAGTLGRGGAERQLVYMLRALGSLGVSTRVVCLTKGEPFENEIKSLGVPVEWIGKSHLRPLRLCRLVRTLRQQPPDILQSVHFYTNLYAAVAARITGTQGVCAIRSDLVNELKANGAWGRWHLHLPKHLIANSELARQRAIALGVSRDRINFIPNAVDPEWLNRNNRSTQAKTVRILFAGRLVREKQPHLFLQAVSRAIQRRPGDSVKITIAGDGPMRSELESLANRLGLPAGQIEFRGTLDDMARAYREADLLVMTSAYEGTPNVLLEAMASGLPVVAPRVGGIPEIINDRRGVLVKPDDEDALVAAIVRLINDPNLRRKFGRQGREYVNHVHSLSALGHELVSLYQGVLSG